MIDNNNKHKYNIRMNEDKHNDDDITQQEIDNLVSKLRDNYESFEPDKKSNEKSNLEKIVCFCFFWFVVYALQIGVVVLAWNYIIVPELGLQKITVFSAFALLFLYRRFVIHSQIKHDE